jgi:hypothetical protein
MVVWRSSTSSPSSRAVISRPTTKAAHVVLAVIVLLNRRLRRRSRRALEAPSRGLTACVRSPRQAIDHGRTPLAHRSREARRPRVAVVVVPLRSRILGVPVSLVALSRPVVAPFVGRRRAPAAAQELVSVVVIRYGPDHVARVALNGLGPRVCRCWPRRSDVRVRNHWPRRCPRASVHVVCDACRDGVEERCKESIGTLCWCWGDRWLLTRHFVCRWWLFGVSVRPAGEWLEAVVRTSAPAATLQFTNASGQI